MSDKTLYQLLRENGYPDDLARAALANAPKGTVTGVPEQERPPTRYDELMHAGGEGGGPAALLRQLLQDWCDQPNLTPGQHPATRHALDALAPKPDKKEAQDGETPRAA